MARWAWLRMDQRMSGPPIMDVANGRDHPRDVNFSAISPYSGAKKARRIFIPL